MKKFIGLTIKKYIPFIVISLIIFVSASFFTFISKPIFYSFSDYVMTDGLPQFIYNSVNDKIMSNIRAMAIPLIGVTCIGALIANTYRYSIKDADLYYQVGQPKRTIRFVYNLVVLGLSIAIYTFVFIFFIGLEMVRELPYLGLGFVAEGQYTNYYHVQQFVYYIPLYFLLGSIGILNYFISYFFVTRSNNFINSLIMLLFGHLALGFLFYIPLTYVDALAREFYTDSRDFLSSSYHVTLGFLIGTKAVNFVGPISWLSYGFTGLISGFDNELIHTIVHLKPNEYAGLVMAIISLVLYLSIGGFTIFSFLKERESSGEIAGKAIGRGKLQYIIYHVGFGVIIFWSLYVVKVLFGESIPMLFANTLFTGAAYYVFYGILRRNFKPNLKGILIMAGNLTFSFVLILSLIVQF